MMKKIGPIKARKISVIDDDKNITMVIARYLARLGFDPICAFNGRGGLKLAKRKKPDMIILDIVMPGMDGYQVLEKLKENEHTIHIPVLILTAKIELDDRIKASQHYSEEYIFKPFDLYELREKIEAVFGRRDILTM